MTYEESMLNIKKYNAMTVKFFLESPETLQLPVMFTSTHDWVVTSCEKSHALPYMSEPPAVLYTYIETANV